LCRSAATNGSSQASRSSRQSPTIASLHKLAPYESPIGQKGNPPNYKSAKVVLDVKLKNGVVQIGVNGFNGVDGDSIGPMQKDKLELNAAAVIAAT
jgi:hypothetical protein